MSIAVCAIGMAACAACVFGIGMVGKVAARFRRRSDDSHR
jgi:hypothetical protein